MLFKQGRCFGKMGKLKKVNGKTTNSQLVAESSETKKGINSFFILSCFLKIKIEMSQSFVAL